MAVAEPHAGLFLRLFKQGFVKLESLAEISELAQRRGPEVEHAEVFLVDGEDLVEQLERFGGPASPSEHEREVRPRRVEARRYLYGPAKQILGIAPAPDPAGELGQHSDSRRVERVFLEVRLEQALGDVEAVLVERHRGLD
jgi:hypothetical protein